MRLYVGSWNFTGEPPYVIYVAVCVCLDSRLSHVGCVEPDQLFNLIASVDHDQYTGVNTFIQIGYMNIHV